MDRQTTNQQTEVDRGGQRWTEVDRQTSRYQLGRQKEQAGRHTYSVHTR